MFTLKKNLVKNAFCRSFSSANSQKQIMSAGEAITETLVSRDVEHVISITGSAFLPASDCFETAGIRLVHVQHEQNAGFCIDGTHTPALNNYDINTNFDAYLFSLSFRMLHVLFFLYSKVSRLIR